MKHIFKNFWYVLKKFKTSSAINIAGLAAALVVFLVTMIQVEYDFGYDRGYRDYQDISALWLTYSYDGQSKQTINQYIPVDIAGSIPEIEAYCVIDPWNGNKEWTFTDAGEERRDYDIPGFNVTQGFWDVFDPEVLAGDTDGIFDQPHLGAISEKFARTVFGDRDPIGQILHIKRTQQPVTIKAVFRDFPENSTMSNGLYTHLFPSQPGEWSYVCYARIKKENLPAVNEKLQHQDAVLSEDSAGYFEDDPAVLEFRPLYGQYLYEGGNEGGANRRINTTLSLLAIGILTLLIAFANFVNLALAMAPSRVKSLAIRRIMGADKFRLRVTVAMESVLYVLIALPLAMAAIYGLQGSIFATQLFTSDLSLSANSLPIAVTSVTVLVLAFAIGLFVSGYSSSSDEASVLKGTFTQGNKGTRLRNILITVQFATAIALICFSAFVRVQHDYMQDYEWGIPKENILFIESSYLGEMNKDLIGAELCRDPRVLDWTTSMYKPGGVGMKWGREFEGKQIHDLSVWPVDARFFDFFEVDMISGEKPEESNSSLTQMVFNQRFLDEYGLGEDIVGKYFTAFGDGDESGKVVAIARDVNFESLHYPIKPMAFAVFSGSYPKYYRYLFIKVTGEDVPGTIDHIKSVWESISDEPFEIHFLDQTLDRLYQKETNMANLIGLFGAIIIVIALMGVYGLVLFNARHRQKEIGIRKVNGATNSQIVLLLNRNLVITFSVAFVIAVPVAYFAITSWVSQFAYRSTLPWWLFPATGLAILLVSLATVTWQSMRTARTNPVDTLKSE